MRRSRRESRAGRSRRTSSRPDRLTKLLVGLAIALAVLAGIIVLDLLLSSDSDELALETPGSGQLEPVPGLSIIATSSPTATPTAGTPPACIAPADWGIHVVKRGETLFTLSLQYDTGVETLKHVNCVDGTTIFTGQELYVPGPEAKPTFATPTPSELLAPTSTPTPMPSATPEAAAATQLPAIAVPTPDSFTRQQPAFRVNIPNRYLNVVLLGTDLRPENRIGAIPGRRKSTWRTDAIIIASLDVQDHSVRLLHIPRDLYVYVPDYGYGRINSADMWGEIEEPGSGTDWVKKTIYHNLGIPIHYYVKMDFEGFINIVDALGGVEIDLACPVPDLELEPGMHRLNGEQAFFYVESRLESTDFDRGRRQRKFLMAMWDQFLTSEIIPKLPELWSALSDNFETDLPLDQVIKLAYVGLQVRPQNIHQAALAAPQIKDWTTPEGAMVLVAREDEMRTYLEELYAPVVKAPSVKVDKVYIQVLNGSQRRSAEELAAAALSRKGIKVVGTGQADRQEYAHTQIRVFKGDPAGGEWIAKRLGVPKTAVLDLTTAPDPPDHSDPVDIKVVVGADYDPCQR